MPWIPQVTVLVLSQGESLLNLQMASFFMPPKWERRRHRQRYRDRKRQRKNHPSCVCSCRVLLTFFRLSTHDLCTSFRPYLWIASWVLFQQRTLRRAYTLLCTSLLTELKLKSMKSTCLLWDGTWCSFAVIAVRLWGNVHGVRAEEE